ncbi:MAG: hypothetical protein NVS3B25_32350 [Hymenobacter sp.]
MPYEMTDYVSLCLDPNSRHNNIPVYFKRTADAEREDGYLKDGIIYPIKMYYEPELTQELGSALMMHSMRGLSGMEM